MRDLIKAIPDVEVLLALQPEELGAKLIFVMRERAAQPPSSPLFGLINCQLELYQERHDGWPKYPMERRADVELALAEAWAWLEAQGLLIKAPGQVGEYRVLSRRARAFENEAEFADYTVSRMLPKEILHPRIARKVWLTFMRNEYDVAVFKAMKAVEVAVRAATNLPGKFGIALMREAFHPEKGSLRDKEAEASERQALSDLFAGAFGVFRNPHAHNDVLLTDPREAVEIIMLANHLLRIVCGRSPA